MICSKPEIESLDTLESCIKIQPDVVQHVIDSLEIVRDFTEFQDESQQNLVEFTIDPIEEPYLCLPSFEEVISDDSVSNCNDIKPPNTSGDSCYQCSYHDYHGRGSIFDGTDSSVDCSTSTSQKSEEICGIVTARVGKKRGRKLGYRSENTKDESAVCDVCGSRAGKHSYYGGDVCQSCRAFFRR